MQSSPTQLVRFLFFTEVNGIPLCLVCSQQVSVVKQYNIRHHYELITPKDTVACKGNRGERR